MERCVLSIINFMDKRYENHNILVELMLMALQKKYKVGRFFRRDNNSTYIEGKRVRKLERGNGDIWGIIDGIHFEFEIKTGSGKLTKAQKKWKNMIESCGGRYVEVRKVSDIDKV